MNENDLIRLITWGGVFLVFMCGVLCVIGVIYLIYKAIQPFLLPPGAAPAPRVFAPVKPKIESVPAPASPGSFPGGHGPYWWIVPVGIAIFICVIVPVVGPPLMAIYLARLYFMARRQRREDAERARVHSAGHSGR